MTAPTALIADDEEAPREQLRAALGRLWPELQLVAASTNGAEAWDDCLAHEPAIAFLDIRMPGLTGLQVADALQGAGTRVVFVTAYDAHAVEAFEAQAVDYVLKPVELPRLAKTVARLREALTSSPTSPGDDWLQVAVGSQVRLLHVDDVQYFESDSKYTRVVAADCDGLVRLSLKELLERLGPARFMQVHRSVVVNRRHVHGVHRAGEALALEIKGRPERLKVSTPYHHLFKAL